ncbi:replication protein A 70 kDa DNA-binding subunit A-like [Helianthus annuus]|uniref:replication protein A 70 kDa DNA-binding subunit A-like n=1 Tax=Helianthus annuus TaxID=4232 RepID=UPI000B8EFA04|nr:replication protein A 70 kDa DNA-binding subunit A-like [Helianthus annuus]
MSRPVENNNLSFVDDLNPAKDMWNIKAQIIQKWNQGFKMDLILIDEKVIKLQEDDVVILSKFVVGENKDQYKVVAHDYKINFYQCTTVTRVRECQCVEYGFNFIPYKDILQVEAAKSLSIDVARSVVWCGALEFRYSRLGVSGHVDVSHYKRLFLSNVERWYTYKHCFHVGFNDFISKNATNEHVMAVIQHGKCKDWKNQFTVQSDKFATRLFLNEEIDEVNQLRRSLILHHRTDNVKKHVDEISEIEKEMSCVVVATIKIVQEDYGWFYVACRKCFKKVIPKTEYLQNVENVSEEILQMSTTALVCPKCGSECTSINIRFKLQVRVQDDTGSVSFVMFDRDVHKIVGLAASDIRERQMKANDTESFPHEISRLVDKKLAFKIDVSEFNLKNDYHVYTVQKTCDDLVIIAQLVMGDDNGNENADEVTQEATEIKDVNLLECSQDIVSITVDSSVVQIEKDFSSSPNRKRTVQDVDVVNVSELSSNMRRGRSHLSFTIRSLSKTCVTRVK